MTSGEPTNPCDERTKKAESLERTDAQEVLSTSGIGFRFVRFFLFAILLVVGCMVGIVILLGWRLGMDVTVKGQGLIQPISLNVVKSRQPGLIKAVFIRQGQYVKEGDLLLTLDDTDLRNELKQVESELRINRIRRTALPTELERERAIIETEIARAEADRETEIIHMEQVRIEFEFYHTALPYQAHKDYNHPVDKLIPIRIHKAKLRRAEAEIEHGKRRLSALNSRNQELSELRQINQKIQTQVSLLKTHLEQMNICAPVAGTVLTRDLEKRIGDHLATGEAILEMAELSGWQAEVMIPEIDIPKIKNGQIARLYVSAFPHMQYKVFEGTVTDIPNKPEVGSGPAEGVFYGVKVRIKDPVVTDGIKQYSLTYGMGVEAKIVTERGPIAELIWRKFLKSVGRIKRPEIYQLKKDLSP